MQVDRNYKNQSALLDHIPLATLRTLVNQLTWNTLTAVPTLIQTLTLKKPIIVIIKSQTLLTMKITIIIKREFC
jgi:hypothetical protein